MSIIDKLLLMDKGKFAEVPTKKIEIPRLSALLGEKFEVTCKAIDGERYSDIRKNAIDINKKGNVKGINIYQMQVLTLIDGVVEPSLKDPKLLAHFGCVTPKDLVKTLFLGGEIDDIANTISNLSGYDKDEDDEEELKKQ